MSNKLDLDFSIETAEDRAAFVESLPHLNYTTKELETIANYILYGKDEKTQIKSHKTDKLIGGSSAVDRGEIEIKTKYSSYQRSAPQSLEELLTLPGFNEAQLTSISDLSAKLRIPKNSFNREKDWEIPNKPDLSNLYLNELEPLWEQIDILEIKLGFCNGKSVEDLSKKYIARIGREKFLSTISEISIKMPSRLSQYKMKHLLVALRKQQYTIKDEFKPIIYSHNQYTFFPSINDEILWGDGVYEVAPLGFYEKGDLKFEAPYKLPIDSTPFQISPNAKFILDFTNPDHIYALFEMYEDLENEVMINPLSNSKQILDTLNYYLYHTKLSDSYKEILALKIRKLNNSTIAKYINGKYGCAHAENYISTIYCKRICNAISKTASINYEGYINRLDPFKWKTCSCCKVKKLRNSDMFAKKSRSFDGYSNTCKACEKIKRELKK
jgi:hypothetical protein